MGIEIVNEDVTNTDNGRMAIFGIGTYNRDFSIDYKAVYCNSNLSLIEVFKLFYNFINNYKGEDISDILYSKYKLSLVDGRIKCTNEPQDYITIDGETYIEAANINNDVDNNDPYTILLPGDIPPFILITDRFSIDEYRNPKILCMFILDQWHIYYENNKLATMYNDITFEMELVPKDTVDIMSFPAFLTLIEELKFEIEQLELDNK